MASQTTPLESAALALVARMQPADVREANKFLLSLDAPSTLFREVEALGLPALHSMLSAAGQGPAAFCDAVVASADVPPSAAHVVYLVHLRVDLAGAPSFDRLLKKWAEMSPRREINGEIDQIARLIVARGGARLDAAIAGEGAVGREGAYKPRPLSGLNKLQVLTALLSLAHSLPGYSAQLRWNPIRGSPSRDKDAQVGGEAALAALLRSVPLLLATNKQFGSNRRFMFGLRVLFSRSRSRTAAPSPPRPRRRSASAASRRPRGPGASANRGP